MSRFIFRSLLFIAVLFASGIVLIYAISEFRFTRAYAVPASPVLIVNRDKTEISAGQHVAVAIAKCVECHNADYGGKLLMDQPMFGKLIGTNLTAGKGGIGSDYTIQDWDRAVRHGIGKTGLPIPFMPSHEYAHLSDREMGALISYMQSLPPIDRVQPISSVGLGLRALFVFGLVDAVSASLIDHSKVGAIVKPGTRENGERLAKAGGCLGCHGDTLSGGKIPAAPPDFAIPTNITPDKNTGIGNWSERDFDAAIRTGKRPGGMPISDGMPWKASAGLTDSEVHDLWLYVSTVSPKPFGGR